MPAHHPALPYAQWSATCDTLHAHTQVLGKLAAKLAPPEPRFQHLALRLTARGWETLPLPAPDGSGAIVVTLDLRSHEALAEHTDGRLLRVALTPDRPVGAVTRELVAAVSELAGGSGAVAIDPTPQEVAWTVPLDRDEEHARYDRAHVARYFAAATQAAIVLGAFRAPYRGPRTPVNAWWGSFDLAVSLFSGPPAGPAGGESVVSDSTNVQELAVGWWPGDERHPTAAFYAYAHPAQPEFATAALAPAPARWDAKLGEHLLDWDDIRTANDPGALALEFARSAFAHACAICDWDPALLASAEDEPPPAG
jgi:hypothetical protein